MPELVLQVQAIKPTWGRGSQVLDATRSHRG